MRLASIISYGAKRCLVIIFVKYLNVDAVEVLRKKKKETFFCELNALPEMAIRVNAGFQTRDLA